MLSAGFGAGIVMRFSIKTIALCIGFFCALTAGAKADPSADTGAAGQIVLPSGGDDYAKLAARAAAHDTSVDFRALRFAYLTSAARKSGSADENALRQALFASVKSGAAPEAVRDAAVKLLSADYIDMYGHKFLRQACTLLHDDACVAQEHFVEFGLLTSITKTGDGKTCATGWEVAAIKEEYFIMSIMGANVTSQALVDGPPSCDLLNGTGEDGNAVAYYFRIEAVLADEAAMLGLH
jgi:hypothetical protein